MPIISNHFSVGTARVQIVEAAMNGQHVCIHNHEHSSANNVYIGGSDVSITNGIHAQATLTSQVTIGPGDSLWAVADGGTNELQIMVIRQD
jgi:hypothetical protein